ncbi:dynamin family protein [Oceanobacillus senegalensis]|uniref:dynamin family protein n=1 Tax=Oceanobacillus senegalensis TaxID=1936063 RepID=UPI000A312144|nr:dynamin family protein [Oceanobacillus senegalensis]
MNSIEIKSKKSTMGLEHLTALYKLMMDNGDHASAKKIVDLYDKRDKNEWLISFSGHFSAGKSSMINALVGEEILPKSPIPTSANVVKITSGEGFARVYLYNDEILEFKEPYDIDQIKEYSKNKNDIKEIEISTGEQFIPAHCALMDTPGIDAADDADRIMTESSLHLVDVLFYVMDYNHVQSEVNLQFLQSIQEKGIPYYVIINQIDKHDEEELTFKHFQQSIYQTFDQWNIKPVNVFYSSLMDPTVKNNQFAEIQQTLFRMMSRDPNQPIEINSSLKQVVEEHKVFLKDAYESQINTDLDEKELEERLDEMEKIHTNLKTLQGEASSLARECNEELQSTLSNAYLMPAKLRDKAHEFLESQQSNFKVGFFSSKKKTQHEKERRLDEFLHPLQETMEASIQWKLREKFGQLLDKHEINDQELLGQVQSLEIQYDERDLIKLINPGAKVNGDYVLNYTKEVANDIKNKYRRELSDFISQIKNRVSEKNRLKENDYKDRLSQLEQVQNYKQKKDQLDKEYKDKLHLMETLLDEPNPSAIDWERIESARNKKLQNIKHVDEPIEFNVKDKVDEAVERKREDATAQQTVTGQLSVEEVVSSIEKTINSIGDLPGFETLQEDLKEKSKRLTNRSYTIALFGAFSAGKSSFANALIGENALPVSPNPTTATVNRICPVTDKYKHGTVVVTLKDDQTLVHDLQQMMKKFSPKETEFQSLLQWMEKENIHNSNQLNKMYQSYLHALLKGYEQNKDSIGKQIEITLDDFEAYVTDESIACYIESIDLYYSSALTDQGITLVDTPGADSVNARHTNVAFEYIKHADAILYVTYYNHALSRADRDFLMQLGRVKEAFQLDKMFFMVNAADLAHDEKELSLVVDYVQEQLLELGIRLPRLYPVSSKQSLKEKQNKLALNEQMTVFEESFYSFINHDLASLTVDAALWDMKRTLHALTNYIQSMNLDESEKERRRLELTEKKDTLREQLVNSDTSIYDDRIRDKMDKQLYYVNERLGIRFHDMFKEYFNPTTITESGKKAHRQLRANLESLIDYVGYELYQELQAVSLRLEAFLQETANDFYETIRSRSIEMDELFDLGNWPQQDIETPKYQIAFQEINLSVFDKAITTFRGTKAFFEKNEKEQMKDQLYSILSPFAKEYIDQNKLVMQDGYFEQWKEIAERMKNFATSSIENHVKNYEEMMESTLDMSVLVAKKNNVQSELEKHGI